MKNEFLNSTSPLSLEPERRQPYLLGVAFSEISFKSKKINPDPNYGKLQGGWFIYNKPCVPVLLENDAFLHIDFSTISDNFGNVDINIIFEFTGENKLLRQVDILLSDWEDTISDDEDNSEQAKIELLREALIDVFPLKVSDNFFVRLADEIDDAFQPFREYMIESKEDHQKHESSEFPVLDESKRGIFFEMIDPKVRLM